MDEETELEIILEDIPKLPEGFSEAMTVVFGTPANAKVFFCPHRNRLEIYPLKGGWIGAAHAPSWMQT